MKIEFTNHAKQRIFLERGISLVDIKKVIKSHQWKTILPGSKIKCSGIVDDRTLVVVYFMDRKGIYVIVTAYFK